MIPQQLLQDRRNIDNLLQYLTSELQRCRGERGGLEEDWARYQRLYRAKPAQAERTFPWKGAANLEIPVIATDIDTTVAGLIGALYAAPNLWATEALRGDWMELAARLQEFLGSVQETDLQMYPTVVEFITELCKLGTGILKWRYVRETRKVFEWREQPNGVLAQLVKRMTANRPEIKRVALPDFYLPATAGSVQEAPWCFERIQLTWSQLEQRVRAGIYLPDTLDRIGYHWRQSQARSDYGNYQSVQEQLDNFVPGFGDKFELFEGWTRYDIDRDQEPEALVCTIHPQTMTYARIDFNPFFSQEYPYAEARFIRQEGRFYGLGLCEILEHFQEEIGAMHRQRIDNGTIRNAAVFKGRRGSGVKADEMIWPGRTILMDNPEEDLIPMQMGIAAESTIDDEQFTLQYARMRSGIGDYQRGGAGNPAISYSTATTTVEMLRQGRLRLDQVLREIQSCFGKAGQAAVELYQQFDQRQKVFNIMGPQDGRVVQQVLQFPLDLLRSGVAIRVTATSAQLNRETQIRTNQLILGMVSGLYQQAIQALQFALTPQVPPPIQQMAIAWVQAIFVLGRRTLDEYDIQDLDRIIPDLMGGNSGGQAPGSQPQFGGTPVGYGPPQQPGLPAGMPGPGGAYAPGPGNPADLLRFAQAFGSPGQVPSGPGVA
jgi:hypothetical protein